MHQLTLYPLFKCLTLFVFLLISACDTTIIEPSPDEISGLNQPPEKTQANTRPEVNTPALTSPSDLHMLWEVKGKNGNSVYLVGSVHLMKPDIYPLDDVFQSAFEDAEKLVFEIDEEIQNPLAAQQAVQKYAGIDGGVKLAETLSPTDYSNVKTLAKEKNIPMIMIDAFDPWFSSMNLAVMQYMNAGMSPEFGIDQHFMQRAQAAGKPIFGLETLDDQFRILDSISYALQVEMLIETLKEEEKITDLVDILDKNWREGNIDKLAELLLEEFNEEPEFYEKMLKNRNEKWMPQILPMLEDTDDYMIVVGAAHMLGEDGVLNLLEQAGYSLKQL